MTIFLYEVPAEVVGLILELEMGNKFHLAHCLDDDFSLVIIQL